MDNICDISDDEELIHSLKHVTNDTIDVTSDKLRVDSHVKKSNEDKLTTNSCLSTSPLMSPNTCKSLLPQQTIRSELRRDFLRLLSSLHKRKVLLKLYECPLVLSATFDGCDYDLRHIFVSSFVTPIGLEKSAIVRTQDICELEFDL
ncbi:uncharacterized protein LOC128957504 [Oppia nitens]|uniref:uncharacterized protein LOC128957504 n=1 Tax=Oppia nitens TaxID=1686743 RepID=UPI0023DBD250|nr:uncharacterized protein LOC128957504 [Oppia nitens]